MSSAPSLRTIFSSVRNTLSPLLHCVLGQADGLGLGLIGQPDVVGLEQRLGNLVKVLKSTLGAEQSTMSPVRSRPLTLMSWLCARQLTDTASIAVDDRVVSDQHLTQLAGWDGPGRGLPGPALGNAQGKCASHPAQYRG